MAVPFQARRAEQLVTERLLLEALEPAHAAEMAVVLADPELYRYVGGRPPSPEELHERYERQARGRSDDGSQRWLNWVVRERASGAAVGYVQATVTVASAVAEVAWVIGTRFQRRGYAGEAASAMLSWLRGNGIASIAAHVHPENDASARVARAIGLVPDGEVVGGEVGWQSAS